jgi:hypothetical protein
MIDQMKNEVTKILGQA